MKTTYKIMLTAVVLILSGLIWSCGKSDTADIYIPDINGAWLNQNNANDQFSFINAPANAASGSFTGNESVNGAQVSTFVGSFNHSKINIVVTSNDNSVPVVTYNGTISGSSKPVMKLSSDSKTLILNKQ